MAGRNQQFQPIADGGTGEGARAERNGHQATSGPAKHEERGDREAARVCGDEALSGGRETVAALLKFEEQIAHNIQEDQRIIVVDAEGFVLGLVVDHVHEVLNVPKNLMEPPPRITSSGGMELSGVAKLDDGARLIMLLDVAHLMKDQKLRDVQNSSAQTVEEDKTGEIQKTGASAQELSEVQLVTFMLGAEEYGVPISQIQEIDNDPSGGFPPSPVLGLRDRGDRH